MLEIELFAELGSGVRPETTAVFVQIPTFVAVAVMFMATEEPAGIEPSTAVIVPVLNDQVPCPSETDWSENWDGKASVTTTLPAVSGPEFVMTRENKISLPTSTEGGETDWPIAKSALLAQQAVLLVISVSDQPCASVPTFGFKSSWIYNDHVPFGVVALKPLRVWP